MTTRISNNTKAILFPDNIREMGHVRREKCLIVQKMDYKLEKSRDHNGTPVSALAGGIMDITLGVDSANALSIFYKRLSETDPSAFSLAFNADFDSTNMLSGYYSAMIVEGYFTRIAEANNSNENYSEVNLQILITAITQIGEDDDMTFYTL